MVSSLFIIQHNQIVIAQAKVNLIDNKEETTVIVTILLTSPLGMIGKILSSLTYWFMNYVSIIHVAYFTNKHELIAGRIVVSYLLLNPGVVLHFLNFC